MEKLTLEQLSAYLPYGLKSVDENGIIRIIDWQHQSYTNNFVGLCHVLNTVNRLSNQFKPLLRPLSDLTKPITHNGETFVPIENIAIYSPTNQGLPYLIEQIKTGFIEVIVFNKLVEWHFDLFGLIDKGLAIDLNTIK